MPKRTERGFTLIELMIVVAIVGILAVLAVYSVRKYVAHAKVAEARNSLGQMAKDASTAYEKEGTPGRVLPLGSAAGVSHRMCIGHPWNVPNNAALIRGQKYQSRPAEWVFSQIIDGVSMPTGFSCLRFAMQDPQYFMYAYSATWPGTDVGNRYAAIAMGDLDGNGVLSNLSVSGEIMREAGGSIVLVTAPNFIEFSPEE
jgi:type IV pilus assembly protein PilA